MYRTHLVAVISGFVLFCVGVQLDSPSNAIDRKLLDTPTNRHYPMFGGSQARNFVNLTDTNFSTEFPKSDEEPEMRILGKRVKWKQSLGARAYPNPIVANGKLFIGTNNDNPRNKRDRGRPTNDDPEGPPLDKGVLICLEEKSGKFLWQMIHDKLDPAHDWPRNGLWSTPIVDGNRLYYTANNSVVLCLDVNGFADGNQGVQDEQRRDVTDGDVIWSYDLVKELGVFPHHTWTCSATCSPLIVGNRLFIVTPNGWNYQTNKLGNADAPAFVCLDKDSGKLLWKSTLPNQGIMNGQWSNPTYGVFGGKPTVIFPGGDGWLYGLEPETGKMRWKLDANRKDAKPFSEQKWDSKSHFVGTPVVYKDKIYIATGAEAERWEGMGELWCIDPADKSGDISAHVVTAANKIQTNPNSGVVWNYGGPDPRLQSQGWRFSRTMATPCIVDDVLYLPTINGYVHCFDAATGKLFWRYDLRSTIWGSCYYADQKVFFATEEGDLYIFKHHKNHQVLNEETVAASIVDEVTKKAKADGLSEAATTEMLRKAQKNVAKKVNSQLESKYLLQKIQLGECTHNTPVLANGVLYVAGEKTLYAVKRE